MVLRVIGFSVHCQWTRPTKKAPPAASAPGAFSGGRGAARFLLEVLGEGLFRSDQLAAVAAAVSDRQVAAALSVIGVRVGHPERGQILADRLGAEQQVAGELASASSCWVVSIASLHGLSRWSKMLRGFCHYSQFPGRKKIGNFVREFSANILLRAFARSTGRPLEMRRDSFRACRTVALDRHSGFSNLVIKSSRPAVGVRRMLLHNVAQAPRRSASETFLGGAGEAAGVFADGAGTSGSIGGSTSIPTVTPLRSTKIATSLASTLRFHCTRRVCQSITYPAAPGGPRPVPQPLLKLVEQARFDQSS